MPANINQVTTANTFQQWLVATQDLVAVANNLTNGVGGTFYANTNFVVGGELSVTGNLTVSGNVTLDSAGFDDLSVAGSVNSTNLNTSTANITSLVGTSNTAIYNYISAISDQSIAFAIALG
jgi:hypothetical protein